MFTIETCDDFESDWEVAAYCRTRSEVESTLTQLGLWDELAHGWARVRGPDGKRVRF